MIYSIAVMFMNNVVLFYLFIFCACNLLASIISPGQLLCLFDSAEGCVNGRGLTVGYI